MTKRCLGGMLALWLAVWVAPVGAQIAMKVNGEPNFNVPADLANYVHVDFATVTLASQNPSKLTTSGTAFTFPTTPTLTAFSSNRAMLTSGSGNGGTAWRTSTINFVAYPSFVEFLWGVSVDYENSMKITFTHDDNTTAVINNCQANTSTCVGGYAPSWWLSDLIAGLLGLVFGSGDPSFDTAHVSYTPPTGRTIKKIDFAVLGYRNCFIILLCSNKTQPLYIDSFRFLNAAVAPDHLQVTTPSASVSGGSTVTFTITACHNAGCTTPHNTNGISGTFSVAVGAGMSVSYPAGQTFTINPGASSTTITATITGAGTATASLSGLSKTPSTSSAAYCGFGGAAPSSAAGSCDLSVTLPLHHVRISASNGVTCSPLTYTLRACSTADCSVEYTPGLTGTLSVTGAGMTVSYPSSANFSITAGQASTTVSVRATTVGNLTTATLPSLSQVPTGSPSVYCGMNGATPASGGSCTVAVTSSLLSVSVPAHYANASATATVTAVRASDSDPTVCQPGFSGTKAVLFKCAYTTPGSGTKPVVLGGKALNAGNSTGAACDVTGQSLDLSFTSGVATTTFQYADAGLVTLTPTYTGSGADAGLTMTGSGTAKVAPLYFDVARVGSGNIKAGNNFAVTVTARNVNGTTTPNFGADGEGVTLSFVRTLPSSGSNGSFSGSGAVTSFSSGVGTSSATLTWSEVGRGDVAAVLTSGSYMSTGLTAAGSSAGASGGWTNCAAEGGTCTLPSGATAYVRYGANGFYATATGVTTSIACTNGVFGDPITGVAKACDYLVTSGASPGAAGGVGLFIPHHFDVDQVTNGCGTFTYGGTSSLGGQPLSTLRVRAENASGGTTSNYHGAWYCDAGNTVLCAAATTLSAATNADKGSLGNASIAATSFGAGLASIASPDTPTFLLNSKQTAPFSVTLRAVDANSVTSADGSEESMTVRSGRIKVSNAFGSENAALEIPVQAQYWSGTAWVLNSQDGCTSIPAASVARSNYLDHKGATTAAWSTTPTGAMTLVGGKATLSLGAPSPAGSVGSVDFALNLGDGATDTSCLAAPRPASTGAGLPWLRSQHGSGNGCTDTTFTRDPSGRATFGIYSPESKKTVFIRELY